MLKLKEVEAQMEDIAETSINLNPEKVSYTATVMMHSVLMYDEVMF